MEETTKKLRADLVQAQEAAQAGMAEAKQQAVGLLEEAAKAAGEREKELEERVMAAAQTAVETHVTEHVYELKDEVDKLKAGAKESAEEAE